MNIFEICIRVTGALKYIIYTSNKLLVFETTDLYFLDTNIWKNKCFNKLMKVNIKHFSEYIFWLLKYYQHKIRREIMSLNVWQYHLTQNPYFSNCTIFACLQLASSVNLLCFHMCSFYCPRRKKRGVLLSEWTNIHIWQHIR